VIRANTPIRTAEALHVAAGPPVNGGGVSNGLGAAVVAGEDPRFPSTFWWVELPICEGQTVNLTGKHFSMRVRVQVDAGGSLPSVTLDPPIALQSLSTSAGWTTYTGTFSGSYDGLSAISVKFAIASQPIKTVSFWIDDVVVSD
jgi:hypothetical protein